MFHKLSKKYFLTTSQLIILYIVLIIVSLPGILICMGPDGHLALESASRVSECCDYITKPAHDKSTQFSQMTGIYSDKGHCGPCIDIAISIDSSDKSTLKAQDLSSEIKGKVFSPLLTPLPVLIEISTEGHFPQTPPTVYPKITSLQTVILLC